MWRSWFHCYHLQQSLFTNQYQSLNQLTQAIDLNNNTYAICPYNKHRNSMQEILSFIGYSKWALHSAGVKYLFDNNKQGLMLASKIAFIIVLNSLALLVFGSIRPFSQQIANQILSQNELYLMYVSPTPNPNVLSIFSTYCQSKSNCTLLESSSQAYHYFSSFIGYPQSSYFVIIDALKHFKYICPIGQYFHTNILLNFQTQFLSNQLEPYFASEDVETFNPKQKCMKLVGRNYQTFLGQQEIVKVVFLFGEQQFCQTCKALFQRFIKISRKYFERGIIRFGYFDVIKNDNRLITDQIAPYFLIYVHDNFEDPYGVGAEQFEDLESYIKQLVQDIKKASIKHDL